MKKSIISILAALSVIYIVVYVYKEKIESELEDSLIKKDNTVILSKLDLIKSQDDSVNEVKLKNNYSNKYISFKYPIGFNVNDQEDFMTNLITIKEEEDSYNSISIGIFPAPATLEEAFTSGMIGVKKRFKKAIYNEKKNEIFNKQESIVQEFYRTDNILNITVCGRVRLVIVDSTGYMIISTHLKNDSIENVIKSIEKSIKFKNEIKDEVVLYLTPDEVKKLEEEAKRGEKLAQYKLAAGYLTGEGMPRNAEKAFYWINILAEEGVVSSQYTLSLLYEMGFGVEKDMKKSLYWKNEAIKNGYIITE